MFSVVRSTLPTTAVWYRLLLHEHNSLGGSDPIAIIRLDWYRDASCSSSMDIHFSLVYSISSYATRPSGVQHRTYMTVPKSLHSHRPVHRGAKKQGKWLDINLLVLQWQNSGLGYSQTICSRNPFLVQIEQTIDISLIDLLFTRLIITLPTSSRSSSMPSKPLQMPISFAIREMPLSYFRSIYRGIWWNHQVYYWGIRQ